MTRIHWKKNNHFTHYGGAGLDMFRMLGYVTEKDSAFTGQGAFSFGFEFDDPTKAASVNALMRDGVLDQTDTPAHRFQDGMQQVDLAADTAGCNLVQPAIPIFLNMVGAQVGEGVGA